MTGVEIFVAALCLHGTPGCNQASSAYLSSNSEYVELKRNLDTRAGIFMDKHSYVVPTATIVGLFASQAINVNMLGTNIVLRPQTVDLKWSYSWK